MGMKEVGIFPASGGLGGSTYRHLLKLVPNDHVTLISRYPEKVEAGYRDAGVRVRKASYESSPQELELAFSGLDVLFLVSYPSHVHDYRVKVSLYYIFFLPRDHVLLRDRRDVLMQDSRCNSQR